MHRCVVKEAVAASATEIKAGVRDCLDAPLDFMGQFSLFGRQSSVENVYLRSPRTIFDDTWPFDTQSAS
ncbi:hypothetical protein HJFPF1_04574 [Paramyrothecium foliicola]|nr:hypothetical protein HJFPF1_04574 [Paramyrothecium foliicola]